jgi:hypothetical protein
MLLNTTIWDRKYGAAAMVAEVGTFPESTR